MKFVNHKGATALLHVLCWCMFLLLPYLFFLPNHTARFMPQSDFNHTWNSVRRDMTANFFLIVFFYANCYWLLPKFFYRKQYFTYAAAVVLFYAAIAFSPVVLFPVGPNGYWYDTDLNGMIRELSHHLLRFNVVFFVSLVLTLNERWKQMQKEKINAELLYLKAQINPHFLFNTLNSIYALAITKSDKTADALVKLSAMMRYITSDTQNQTISLDKEINYLLSYVELQKLRWGNTVNVQFEAHGNYRGKQIEPLILMPFIENAFKHGVNPEVTDAFILIKLFVDEDKLRLDVSNLKVRSHRGGDEHSGTGIDNTRQRLELLYPGKHALEINDAPRIFSITLSLDLT